jgi:hypothetical protein
VDDLELIYNPTGAGLNELNSEKFKVYAGQDQINVFGQFSEDASYVIYSVNGGLIQSGVLKTVIPFDHPYGAYFLKIEDGNTIQRVKFVKE